MGENIFKALFGWLFAFLAAMFVGAAVVTIVYAVSHKITRANLPGIIRDALKNSRDKRAREFLSTCLNAGDVKGKVTNINGNTVSISMLEEINNNTLKLKITGNEIDPSLRNGMELAMNIY